eukprot:TRINITY_DN565_c0_g1_i4.p1 TRINITY_DN565_c0_g1~~TRINITY_DN565_c0_g1_i4.p1  ORF type:complete len:189 (+),score=46.76 TRINITY_DN565_c0_g1_i4:118-684(+)
MKVILLVALCVAFVLAADPPRPKFPEVFEATGTIEYFVDGQMHFGEGFWRVDQPAGKSVQFFMFMESFKPLDIYELERYDMGTYYSINSTNRTDCSEHKVTPPMPSVWGWVDHANFTGSVIIHGQTYYNWEYRQGTSTLTVAVDKIDTNRPVMYRYRNAGYHSAIIVMSWSTEKPHPTWFDVPAVCSK